MLFLQGLSKKELKFFWRGKKSLHDCHKFANTSLDFEILQYEIFYDENWKQQSYTTFTKKLFNFMALRGLFLGL